MQVLLNQSSCFSKDKLFIINTCDGTICIKITENEQICGILYEEITKIEDNTIYIDLCNSDIYVLSGNNLSIKTELSEFFK